MKLIFISVMMMLVSAGSAAGRGWRNIVPLHSTQADVRRLLGVPTKAGINTDYYDVVDEIIVASYQIGPCDASFRYGFWNVPPGTVTDIGIIPKRNPRKEEFGANSLWKVEDSDVGLIYYSDRKEGVSVEVLRGLVTFVSYSATEKEIGLECPNERGILHIFPRFDEYENLSWEDEKARLDNYAIQIIERQGRGVIRVYGKNSQERAKRAKLAERSKKYLYQKHSIHPNRILILDSGYASGKVFGLDLYSIGGIASRIYLHREKDPS